MICLSFDQSGLTRPVFLCPESPASLVYLDPSGPDVQLEYTYLTPDEIERAGRLGWICHDGDRSQTGAFTLWGPVRAVRLRMGGNRRVTLKIEPFHLKEPKNDANLV